MSPETEQTGVSPRPSHRNPRNVPELYVSRENYVRGFDKYPIMAGVVSLGSINIDHTRYVTDSVLTEYASRYDWFPAAGQTIRKSDLPTEFSSDPDNIRHGGKGANQAVASVNGGSDVSMLGMVGPDQEEFGVLSSLKARGVDVSKIGFSSTPTGTAYIFVTPSGENRIIIHPGANDTIDTDYLFSHYDKIRSSSCLLLQNEIPVSPVISVLDELASESNRPIVILDPAPAEGAEQLLGCDAVDYLTPNETEYEVLRPNLDSFGGVLIRKRGGDPVIVDAEQRFTVTPPCVEAVDSTGAGDVFNGFLAAQLTAGASLSVAVEIATIAGSLSTREEGARSGIPSLKEVRSYRSSTR